MSHITRCRRLILELSILAIVCLVIGKIYQRYTKYASYSLDTFDTAVPYNEYIDEKAQFLSYPGYKILQHVEEPISMDFSSLVAYLGEQLDFISYFTLVHHGVHHITLTNLKNQTSISRLQLSTLKEEQELLDKKETTTSAVGKRLYMIDKREVRLEIELINEEFLRSYKEYQKRWDDKFGELIIDRPTSFYLTLAYQYREIPHPDIREEIMKILRLWETLPIEINLGPIEIVSYRNIMSYTPVLSDLKFPN